MEPSDGRQGLTTLEQLLGALDELEFGTEYPVAGNFCRSCMRADLVLVVKLEAVPGSLAGVQLKTSARKWPYLRCRECGRESKGKR